jgi:uncharacterized protein
MEMRGAAMRGAGRVAVGLLGLALPLSAPAARTLDCDGRWLTRTELTICADPKLLRLQEQISRRVRGNASRLSFGQYLGVRHWQAARASERDLCQTDRDCIRASLRAQGRFLDRLQRCVASNLARRACLFNLLAEERASLRR